jgi:hypothetical protein
MEQTFRYLVDTINVDGETNIIEELMAKEKPRKIDTDEWLYKGCFIQKSVHPILFGKYSVFKNNSFQTDLGRYMTFAEAKKICEQNECFDNFLKF